VGSAIVFLAKLIDAPRRIKNFLLAGEERVAGGANLHMEFFLTQSGTGDELVAAAAYNLNILVSRMNIRFHDRLT
jgi:hypothetical protein